MVTEHHLFQTHPHLLAFSTPSKLFHILHHLVNRKSMYWFPPASEPSPVWHQRTANLEQGIMLCSPAMVWILHFYRVIHGTWPDGLSILKALYLTRNQCRYRAEGIGRQGVGVVERWEQEGSQRRWVWYKSSNSSHGPRMLTCCDTSPWCRNELTFPSMLWVLTFTTRPSRTLFYDTLSF